MCFLDRDSFPRNLVYKIKTNSCLAELVVNVHTISRVNSSMQVLGSTHRQKIPHLNIPVGTFHPDLHFAFYYIIFSFGHILQTTFLEA